MNYLELLRWHNYRKCPYPSKCNKNFDDGIIKTVVKNGRLSGWYPDGKFLFHYQATHGVPHEEMIEILNGLVNSEMTEEEVKLYNLIMANQAPVPVGGKSWFEERRS